MRSVLAGLRNLVVPWGAALTAAAMEILTTPPPAIATLTGVGPYAGGVVWRFPGGSRYHFYSMYQGDLLSEVVRGVYDSSHGVRVIEQITTKPGVSQVLEYGDSIADQHEQIVYRASTELIFFGAVHAVAITADISGVAETWHAASFQNGWSNFGGTNSPLSYRKVASPPNCVQLVGVMTPGVRSDGATITTLPAGYRPINSQLLPMSGVVTFPGAGSSFTPTVLVNPDGTVTCAGLTSGAAGPVAVNATFPLDV